MGAGKTTVINHLLSTRPTDARWALLINEFGRIGVDGALLASDLDAENKISHIVISEVSGGCICCTSQLPLEIAITRLLSEHRPQRLIIEPTGLAHPRELIRQLSAPHWQTALSMQAVIAVLSAVQWQQEKYRTHDGFQAHVRDADILVINRYEQLSTICQQGLQYWIATLNEHVQLIWAPTDSQAIPDSQIIPAFRTTADNSEFIKPSNTYLSALTTSLTKLSHTMSQQRTANMTASRTSLTLANHLLSNTSKNTRNGIEMNSLDNELPYRYHGEQQGMLLAGWRLPPHWVFHADNLQQWLLKLPNWQRIKGIIHTSDGWQQLNFTPDSLTINDTGAQIDSRLEIILLANADIANESIIKINSKNVEPKNERQSLIDWEQYDHELIAQIIQSSNE